MPKPSGAASPTKGVPEEPPTEDPAAKAAEDNTVQQLIIDEIVEVREKLSAMMGEDMKEMQCASVVTTLQRTPSIVERDRRAERRKLEEREAQLERELRNYRLDPVTFGSY